MSDHILIVDDEDSVRRTFQEWLGVLGNEVQIYAAPDAESALLIANEHPIDLAILDWNLGSGSDGLQLLEDLSDFQPDVVAILVTGFAHQATPLDALRMGVRDYLDKSSDLNRESFLGAVRRQLDRIRPQKRQRELNRSLAAFRQAVEQVLPLVQSSAALNEPVPLPTAVRSLLRFLIQVIRADDGIITIRHVGPDHAEDWMVYGPQGVPTPVTGVSFSRTIAANVASLLEPVVVNGIDPESLGPVEFLPFEQHRRSILAVPLSVGEGTIAVLELFDKIDGAFTEDDRQLAVSGAAIGGELIRQAMSERQTHRLLFDAVESALVTSRTITESLSQSSHPPSAPPASVMERLRHGLEGSQSTIVNAETTLNLVEAIRELAVLHGPKAVEYCTRTIKDLRDLLNHVTGE